MSQWSERILSHFTADLTRLWVACDPDDVLLDEKLLSELRSRGFEVVAHEQGALEEALTPGDVLVIAHPAAAGSERSSGTGSPVLAPEELDAVEEFVRAGGGLVVLAEEVEQVEEGVSAPFLSYADLLA